MNNISKKLLVHALKLPKESYTRFYLLNKYNKVKTTPQQRRKAVQTFLDSTRK